MLGGEEADEVRRSENGQFEIKSQTRWPPLVALVHRREQWLCTGTVIAAHWILTSALCISKVFVFQCFSTEKHLQIAVLNLPMTGFSTTAKHNPTSLVFATHQRQ